MRRRMAGAAVFFCGFFLTGLPGLGAACLASELGAVKAPDGGLVAGSTVIGFDVSPSLYATTTSSHDAGAYDDVSMTASLSHGFANGILANGSAEFQIDNGGSQQFFIEAGLGYALKAGRFTLTPSAALGTTFDHTGFGPNGDDQAFYYALYLAADLDLDTHWTWNMVNLRYRDAFDYEWVTPQVTSGLTYHLDAATALYGTGSYSWKDTGDGLLGDSMSVDFGIKHAL